MFLEVKNAFKEVFSLKYFWVYLFIFAVFTTFSMMFDSIKLAPTAKLISNIFKILSYVMSAYVLVFTHNLLHKKDINEDNETFLKSLKNTCIVGLKAFVAIFFNAIIIFFIGLIIWFPLTILSIVLTKKSISALSTTYFYSDPVFWLITIFVFIIISIAFLFVLKLVSVNFAKNYAIKDAFKWITTAKIFFKKGNAKKTLAILGLYLLACVILFLILFGLTFLLNLIIVYISKALLVKHFLAVAIMVNVSSVFAPFVLSSLHFILAGIVYSLLAKVYNEGVSEKNEVIE